MTISSWNEKYNMNGQFEGHWLSKSKSNNMNVTWKVIGVLKESFQKKKIISRKLGNKSNTERFWQAFLAKKANDKKAKM